MSRTEAPMDATELRAILDRLGWSQRFAGAVAQAYGERRIRAMAAGKAAVPRILAAWFRHQAAFPPPAAEEIHPTPEAET